MLSLIPLPWKIGMAAILIAAVGVSYGIWRHGIYKEGYQACEGDQRTAIEKGKQKYEKDIIDVRNLADDSLRRELCGSVRDASVSVCRRTLANFRP